MQVEEDAFYVQVGRVSNTCYQDGLEYGNWRKKSVKEKWLNVNKGVTCREVLICCNKDQLRCLGRYLDKVKYIWFHEMTELYMTSRK
jgi:hypothetical protein